VIRIHSQACAKPLEYPCSDVVVSNGILTVVHKLSKRVLAIVTAPAVFEKTEDAEDRVIEVRPSQIVEG
jgi:hypothetical protein